uniref:Cyclase family protein n=1 Tax=Ignisphaera aggregans TaxID=334771 RepID=A0A7C5Z0G5_9CREN
MVLKTSTPVFSAYPQPMVHKWTAVIEHGYYSNIMMLADHTGTHIDAPAHFIANGTTIDELPLDGFICKGTAIDLLDLAPKADITAEIIKNRLKEKHIELGIGWIMIIYTGYDTKAGSSEWFNHPGLDESVAVSQ